jgi:hypothetical protein
MRVEQRQHGSSLASSLLLLFLAVVLLMSTALAPKEGSALAAFSVLPSGSAPFLDWATDRGARIVGTTPFGGLVLDHAPNGTIYSALRHGTIAIAVPPGLCSSKPGN